MPVTIDGSLGMKRDISLSPEQRATLEAISAFDLWFVEERLARKGLVEATAVPAAVHEFKRYMALVGLGYRGLGMLSPDVDEVWHAFILFTREYAAFCQQAFGTFIHHVPRTSRSPQGESGRESFLAAYAEVFGDEAARAYAATLAPAAALAGEPTGCGTEDCTDG